MSYSEYNAHASPICKKLKMLKFKDIVLMSTAKLMYRVTTKLVPVNITVIFTKFYYMHQHNTRFNRNFCIPKFRTKLRSFTLCIIGPKVWNNLDESIKQVIKYGHIIMFGYMSFYLIFLMKVYIAVNFFFNYLY